MNSLQKWISNMLVELNVVNDASSIWDNVLIFCLILLVALLLHFVSKKSLTTLWEQIAKRTKTKWDDIVLERKIIGKNVAIIPAIFMYITIPIAFGAEYPPLNVFLLKICVIFIIALLLRLISSTLSVSYEVSSNKAEQKNKPLKGFVQIIQIIIFSIGIILIISIVVDKSPTKLFAGLGASAAILSFVFKDTLVGFVSGIQLSVNDMLRPGDWITMPKYGADGFVKEVSLITVKVQNWDKTITTIPPYALVSDSFQNWRGMFESGGRRIKRSLNIDMNSVKFCSPEMLERFKKIDILKQYIVEKEDELNSHNEKNNIDDSILVNGRRQTNLGVFRAYIEFYLKHHPQVNHDFICMVRQLQPTEVGIPLELYLFTKSTEWLVYEAAMADIFDHILATIKEFDLCVFQNIAGSDMKKN